MIRIINWVVLTNEHEIDTHKIMPEKKKQDCIAEVQLEII